MNMTVTDIAHLIGGELVGDGSVLINNCAGIQEAKSGDITFLADPKFVLHAQNTQASVILIPRQMDLPGKTFIRVDNPSLAFTLILNRFLEQRPSPHPKGIHSTAIIASNAKLGANVSIGPYTIIESGAVIGDSTVIYGLCSIGQKVVIGSHCLIYPSVTIREDVCIGHKVIVHSGTVIGSDGYGYVMSQGQHIKIPQIGTVLIEDDVEIGANFTIDRARLDKTIIGQGTKIDNLVQIAHNVVTGKHCLIIAQVGISGSTRLGNYVVLAGQAGLVGHLTIGDGVMVAAQAGVNKSLKAGEQVYGSPSQPIKDAFRTNAHVQRLEHYVQTIKDLKKRIEQLEQKNS